MNTTEEKYEALVQYIEAYDFNNLHTLAFPKEDEEYLRLACEKQVPKKPIKIKEVEFKGSMRNIFKSGDCPGCKTYVDTDDDFKFCGECGQKLWW